jgi:DNA-binding HxlR family transcriptional regulator
MSENPSNSKFHPAHVRRNQGRDEQRIGPQKFDPGYVWRAKLASEVLFQSKWRVQILCAMRSGPIRLGQLARLIPGASKKMLTQNLRKLESDGVIIRKDLSDLVLHIEYDIDEEAREAVCALLDHLVRWGDLYLGRRGSGRQ